MRTPRPSPIRISLRASTRDGIFHAAMVGFGETYFAAFALFLGASPFQVGLLATAPFLAGALFQLVAPWSASRFGEKRWVVTSSALQAVSFLPVLALGWFAGGAFRYEWLFGAVCAYWVFALGINPVWNAWMGRLVPVSLLARYFARRNVPVQVTLFVSVLAGGLLIHIGAERQMPQFGFAAAFALAGFCRGVSAWFLSRQHDPGGREVVPAVGFGEVLKRFRTEPYGRLITLLVLTSAGIQVSAAYFTPFMLQHLQLSYAQFTILTGAAVVSRVLASPYWGEIAGTYGNRRALQVATALIVPLPVLWLLSDAFTYLLALQLAAGFAWAGVELTTFLNFFDCTDQRNRAQILSVYNLLNGMAVVAGSVLGGSVLEAMATGGYAAIFLLSTLVRGASFVLLARGVGRRRTLAEHSFHDVFLRVVTLRPGQGTVARPVVLPEETRRRAVARKSPGKPS